ncbi:fungal-specific transcription factor domain-containing protein [Phyllosticta citrichinensis]|uniref:Fungal-specific transcription factor domain-containing protein n=1 Tax=Phyllosticta citrichinensis TaxID=1130410 RepID=A0ABR1XTY4_9PEZI
MMPAKRPAPDGVANPHHQATKLHKSDHHSQDDFSSSVKKKLSASTRTGQACDRCKVRKIRCDPRPGGCSPCMQNNTECKTTDRITGRATIRGHTEALEYENNQLKQSLAHLHQQLRDLGVEPDVNLSHAYSPTPQHQESAAWPNASSSTGQMWGSVSPGASINTLSYAPAGNDMNGNKADSNNFRVANLPTFRTGLNGDNYLGVSSANSVLSPIKGTSLSFYGMELDLGDFVPEDVEDMNNPVSYQHCLAIAMNGSGVERPKKEELPASYSECATYATWYFRGLHPYAPIMYKPHFMDLLSKIYGDPNFRPTPAEEVMVQMVLAIIKYQFSARNNNAESLKQAHAHYRYALSFFYTLCQSHTIKDVQALTMLCLHLRNFPKPGAAWMMASITLAIAVELGLHRSAKAWADDAPKKDHIEIENRKRVFWTLHALHITLSGKLGRPMPLRMEDIDVEFPEPIHDFLPSESNLTEFRKCSFHVGLQAIKIVALSSQMYSTIYAVRQASESYEPNLRRLEEEHRQWREQLPPELREGSRADAEDYVFSLYVQFWDQEFNLMLHHPALCRSTNNQLLEQNIDVCMEAASKMVRHLDEIRKYKSLDVPWINCTVYLAAIFTTLFVYSQREDDLTSSGLAKLNQEMDMWLLIIDECGKILGSGSKLARSCRAIIDHAISRITNHVTKKTATAATAVANAVLKTEPNPSPHPERATAAPYTNNGYAVSYNPSSSANPDMHKPSQSTYQADESAMSQHSNPYTSVPGQQYAGYPESHQASLSSYPNGPSTYDQPSFGVQPTNLNPAHAAAASAAATQESNTTFMYQQPVAAATHNAHNAHNAHNQNDAWRQWMITNLPQDYHHASTLMSLGTSDNHRGSNGAGAAGAGARPGDSMSAAADMQAVAAGGLHAPHPAVSAAAVAQAASTQNQLWPLMVFDIGQSHVSDP